MDDFADCYARVLKGKAAAAPPRSVMRSRRPIVSPSSMAVH
jgi:hypothetical protein